MKKANFDLYLEKQLQDLVFAERFEKAGAAWDVAMQPTETHTPYLVSQKGPRQKAQRKASQ